MDIDLSKVIGYSRDSLQSRALMRSIMLDLYPGKTREMNVLLDVYESGVPRKIKNDGNITDAKYAQYIQKIVDDYGMQEQWAVVGLNAWIDVCLGKGIAATIKYRVVTEPSNGGKASNSNTVGSGYTNPIVHNNSASVNNTPVQGNASDYEIADLGNGTIEIKKFVGFDQADTIIPTEIRGKKVVGIGVDAFKQCKEIKRLIIPEGIEYISEGAFAECDSLFQVTFPTSLKQLSKKDTTNRYRGANRATGAFQGTALKEIDLPNGITEIGESTFSGCDSLAKILFPDNLRIIKSFAFSSCDSLVEIVLPQKVEQLEYGAFNFCKNLSKVTLNEGLKKIAGGVFNYDPALTYLVIPKSVIEFGSEIIGSGNSYGRNTSVITIGCYPGSKAIEYARLNNLQIKPLQTGSASVGQSFDDALKKVNPITHAPVNVNPLPTTSSSGNVSDYEIADLGKGTIEIKKFVGFDQLNTVIPSEINGKRVVGIGANAFRQCKGIKRLIIPEGIEYISEGTFAECSNLMQVTLPTSLKQLGKKDTTNRFRGASRATGAFQGTAIKEIDLPNGITEIGESTFSGCDSLTKILFPDNLRVIKSSAFSSCDSLVEIVLPQKVEQLEYGAFNFCKNLSKVTLNEGLKKIAGGVFNYDPALTYLVIPKSVIEFGSEIIGSGNSYGRNTSVITIGCYPGSKAIEYARLNNLQVKDMSK